LNLNVDAFLFDLDDTLAATSHLDQIRRTRNRAGLQAALPGLRAPDGLADVLQRLQQRVPLGIVTTSPGWYAQTVLQHLYQDIRWSSVVSYGDVRKPKPDPEGLLLASAQLNLPPGSRVAYVGDQDHDMLAARNADMLPVRATWGGALSAPGEHVCDTPAGLFSLLRGAVTASDRATELLTYAQLPAVGRKTLLELLAAPTDLMGVPILPARVVKALRTPGAAEQAKEQALTILNACQALGVMLLCPDDAEYPDALKSTGPDRPALLYVRGVLSPGPALAVIGTREPTDHGRETARRLSTWFAAQGVSIVSGLALGIDGTAHQAALATGGHTVAVLASGPEQAVPRQHRGLADQILSGGGALISEYPPGTVPRPPYFVERDRIQAGLARATAIIQTDLTGGSWHAARASLRYGRPLAFPVPTARDRDNNEPKIAGPQALLQGTDAERCQQLACSADALALLRPLAGRNEYPPLLSELSTGG